MLPEKRILLALRTPKLAFMVGESLLHRSDVRLAGIIDPTINRSFEIWRTYADVILIGADELLWLRTFDSDSIGSLSAMQVVVLVEERQLLDVVGHFGRQFALAFVHESDQLFPERIELALDGYIAMTGPVLRRLAGNQHRLELVDHFTVNEKRVFALIGRAMPNRLIAAETGLGEGRVKALVQSVTRKLRMKNRTEVAVFAATNPPIN